MSLRDYELVTVLNPQLDEQGTAAVLERVTRLITGKGGEVTSQETWGVRKLAYPVKRSKEGNYVLTQFKLEPKDSSEIEAALRLSEEVLRHLLVRKEAAAPKPVPTAAATPEGAK